MVAQQELASTVAVGEQKDELTEQIGSYEKHGAQGVEESGVWVEGIGLKKTWPKCSSIEAFNDQDSSAREEAKKNGYFDEAGKVIEIEFFNR